MITKRTITQWVPLAKESEETEVKKGIDWAIKEIEGLETEPSQNYPHGEMIEKEIVLGILSQLDELGVLSQEWIEQKSIDSHVDTANGDIQVTFILDDLQNLLVPKQELPAIPQFVAELIENRKGNRNAEQRMGQYSRYP